MSLQKSNLPILAFILFSFFSFSQNNREEGRHSQSNINVNHLFNTAENDSLVVHLGYEIQNAIADGDLEKYMSYFDLETFMHSAIYSVNTPPSQEKFKRDFGKGIETKISDLPQKIINEVNNDGYYDLVNYGFYSDTQTYYILCRLYSPETGVNYHEYSVSKKDSKLFFNDIYIYLSGESLSKTLNRMFLYSLPKESLLDIFDDSTTKNMIKMAKAIQKYNTGDFNNAYKEFKAIDSEVAEDKFFLVLKTICASKVGIPEYKESIKNIMDIYPDDASLYLQLIDYHTLNENYDEAISLLNRLETETDDDFLSLLKGNTELLRKNYPEALKHFKYMSDNFPNFFQGHASYLSCLTFMEDFEGSVSFLNFLVEDGYDKNDIIDFIESVDEFGNNELVELVDSTPYKSWKKKS